MHNATFNSQFHQQPLRWLFYTAACLLLFGTSSATAQQASNISAGKHTSQSSNYNGGSVAAKAVDGNTDGAWQSRSLSHTKNETHPWWQVDLGQSANIDQINLYNRTDCCSNRLRNFYVLVSETPFSSNNLSQLLVDSNVWSYHYTGIANRNIGTEIDINHTGRYVRVQLAYAGFLQLAEAEVIGTPAEIVDVQNLAQGAASSQSSDYNSATVAAKAVDGNSDGNWLSRSLSHSTYESNPWWQVDLGANADIEQIKLYNRTDCCSGRLRNFYVLVSQSPFASDDLSILLADENVLQYHHANIASANSATTINVGRQGRYVRVQLAYRGYLQLAEVEVLGSATEINLDNLAQDATTSQSSDYNNVAVAAKAVDGNSDGNWLSRSLSHTTYEYNPWWQVDLGQSADIDHINLYNRTDCCTGRLRNFYVLVSQSPFTSNDLPTLLADENVSQYHHANIANANSATTINVGQMGRYVRVQLGFRGYLQLAEVEVLGRTNNTTNQSPLANDDSVTLFAGSATTVNILGNDADPDGTIDGGSVSITQQPLNGTAQPQADGTVLYTHNGSAASSDSFKYTVLDNQNATSNPATVSITVESAPNIAPIAQNDTAALLSGTTKIISVLDNDSDSDGTIDAASVTITLQPSNGVIAVQTDGTVQYTHNGSVTTIDTFGYTVADDQNATSNQATVSITILPVANVAPSAINDSVTVAIGAAETIAVLANDTDSDGSIDATSVTITQQPANGTAEILADGTVHYSHNGSDSTTDTFSYTVNDNLGATSNLAIVSITVQPAANIAPVANNDSLTTANGAADTITVLANDTDSDGSIDASSVTITQQPANGTAEILADGTVHYSHNGSDSTTDTFSYTVNDNLGATSNLAIVSITVQPAANIAPVANNDSLTTANGAADTITVLANDTDSDGSIDASSVTITQQPANGTAEILADGTIVYTHDGGTSTADTFSYTVADVQGLVSNQATVSITINSAPASLADFTLTPGIPETGEYGWRWGSGLNRDNVTAHFQNTGDDSILSLTGYDIDNAIEVSVSLNGIDLGFLPRGVNNSIGPVSTFTLPADQQVSGTNILVFTQAIRSGYVWGVTNILIQGAANQSPLAVDDSVAVDLAAATTIAILSNDTDTDGTIDTTSVSITLAPANGTADVQPDGTILYTHNGADSTSDTFTYTVADDDAAVSNVATVTVTITPVPNEPPVASDDSATVTAGTGVSIDVLGNDSDSDGSIDTTSVSITLAPANGTADVQPDGTILYTHNGADSTSDTFTYTVADDDAAVSNVATVTVTITPVPNEPPVASDDSATVTAGTGVSIDVLGNDSDSDGSIDTTSVSITLAPANGTAVVQPDGTILYTHNGADSTSDTFTYTVADDDAAVSNVATVTVTITPVPNEPPVASDDSATVTAGTGVSIDVLGNDSDSDGSIDTTSVSITLAPANGTADVQPDGTILYTHNGADSTSDTFSYTVTDDDDAVSNVATVTVTITPVPNEPPVASDDSATVTAGTGVSIDVLGNDSDSDGSIDTTSVSITLAPANGTADVQPDGTILYTHNGADSTSDTFSYTVTDDDAAVSNVATVSISISPPVTGNNTLSVLHRDGQSFLTWPENNQTDGYHVYRHDAPITADNLDAATKLTSRWGPLDSDTSVNPHGGNNAPDHFVISDLAPALSDDTGLFVYTIQPADSASAFYAVTRVDATNNELISDLFTHSTAVSESVSAPTDVLTVSVNDGKGRLYTQFMDYSNWNPTFNGYAYNYSVALPANYNPDNTYPLLIEPHAFYAIYKFIEATEYNWEVIQMFPHDPGPQVGAVHSWWYGYSADHNYLLNGNIPAAGAIENFTEQRLMRSIDSLIAHADFNIDDKLIHAYGNSMGASGALSLGMRYGSVLAGIYANEPMTNYATSPTFTENFEQLWGLKDRNLPIVNRGPHSASIQDYGLGGSLPTGVWDWMDHHQQLVRRKQDSFAYLMVAHGKADTTIDWATQGQPFVQALTDAKAAFSAASFANQGHYWFGFASVVNSLFGFGYAELFPWRYPVDLSFPAIHNASASGSLNPGTTVDDSYNLNIEWATPHTSFADSIVDETVRYEISIRSTSDSSQTADITPRNAQFFTPLPGEACSWTTTDNNNNSSIANGTATADDDGLITIPAVPLSLNNGTLLVIDCDDSGGETNSDR